jgi:hypothetical protein
MIMFITPKIPRNLQWVMDSIEGKKKKNLNYIFMEIHMAKNTKYLTMVLTHKKNYHILRFNVGKKY